MDKPNWVDIRKCPIWPILGVTECNNCEALKHCWGDDADLDAVLAEDYKGNK